MKKCTDKKALHFSHFKIGTSKNTLPGRQNIPSHSILCPKQYYSNLESNMIRHFRQVHVKRQLKCCGTHILFCKYCEVPNRGTDSSSRNNHYHCLQCHKPCDNRWTLGVHLVAKHNFSDTDVESLY